MVVNQMATNIGIFHYLLTYYNYRQWLEVKKYLVKAGRMGFIFNFLTREEFIMTIKRTIGSVVFAGSILLSSPAFSSDDLVKGYLDASGSVVTNSYGDCWRTSYQDSTDKREECGYTKPEPVVVKTTTMELVKTPSAASVTVKQMEKITLGASMLFPFDSAELTQDAKAIILERVNRFQGKGRLTSIMEVRGYTCTMGPEAYNQSLSERRAQAVADYIAEKAPNVAADQIKVVGMGEASPIASNDTKEGRMKNRRVEIVAEAEIQQ